MPKKAISVPSEAGASLPNAAELAEESQKRTRVSQADIPAYSLDEAMRVNYLAVALRARGAIKTLKSLMSARQGVLSLPNPQLQQDLESVLRSLRAVESSKPLHSGLSSEMPYRPYEEVQTFEEVTRSFRDTQALARLEALVAGGCDQDDMRTAIRLFSAVERRALYHYNDPSWAQSGV